jgi:hypothetical protein
MATVAILNFFNPPKAATHCKKNEKHKKDHIRLLAEQKLMKRDKNGIHI